MLLTDLIFKPILVRESRRGISIGVGVSLKNYAVKYLFCNSCSPQNSSADSLSQADFAVHISAVQSIMKTHVSLSSLRPVFPKSCAKLTLGKPVYTQSGEMLGVLQNLEIENGIAVMLHTEKGSFPSSSICAVSDAILLKKSTPYPIGQRIPAPHEHDFLTNKDALVTKAILKKAIEKGALIKLTLSLPPFSKTHL